VSHIKAVAWEEEWETETGETQSKYKVQVVEIAKRSINKVRKSFAGWSACGEGTNHRTKRHLLFFTREFDSKKEWRAWAKEFPYILHEETKRGKLKPMNIHAKKATECN